ncbi:hypothetical protein SUGI_0919950 [Cryptomeria japonica]|nr:hypothetical protein SUGI_0919950 [Cryptomeria japonica]
MVLNVPHKPYRLVLPPHCSFCHTAFVGLGFPSPLVTGLAHWSLRALSIAAILSPQFHAYCACYDWFSAILCPSLIYLRPDGGRLPSGIINGVSSLKVLA